MGLHDANSFLYRLLNKLSILRSTTTNYFRSFMRNISLLQPKMRFYFLSTIQRCAIFSAFEIWSSISEQTRKMLINLRVKLTSSHLSALAARYVRLPRDLVAHESRLRILYGWRFFYVLLPLKLYRQKSIIWRTISSALCVQLTT